MEGEREEGRKEGERKGERGGGREGGRREKGKKEGGINIESEMLKKDLLICIVHWDGGPLW